MLEQLSSILGGERPLFILIAGPNGAGKSTFRQRELDRLKIACIDPDQRAKRLYGRDPASKEEARAATIDASASIRIALQSKESVALETVFSDDQGHKLGLLQYARAQGYKAGVIFIGLDDPMLCVARVMDRVTEGGHDVPDELIHSRYPRCFENLKKAREKCDFLIFVDNSGEHRHRIFGAYTQENGLDIWSETPSWFNRLGF